ncbi:uncharacterized protein L3040_009061 [Drepanopeziza brunnea f. sp. 'multigermtubi']|uniref:uncharacterized protein n=1 Tax=Drepanopeziza brunnea f. sp. 'multigermtubi' TaxID=698441 RepID=UPI002388022A|nr:hypothetical protein L3040_009061 [Drepanopeziza brunnea f. sp. 'multigermtubi']
MAPSTTAPNQLTAGRRLGGDSSSREATPAMARSNASALISKSRSDAQLATSFKTDLTEIRSLVTCTVCDLLLYEPWTLGCGHTYCYSCLCQWFDQHKHKKTCPECRAKVKQIPSPNFLIKQMVDQVFTKRLELMPADESIEQHAEKRAEEIAIVENDKGSPNGIFRGLFKERGRLMRDDGDGVMRCPECHHEYLGGPVCTVCGFEVDEEEGFSDASDYDHDLIDDLEQDLDAELGAEFDHMHDHHRYGRPRALLDLAANFHPDPHMHHYIHEHHHRHGGSIDGYSDSMDGSFPESDSDEDGGSLQDFVVQDDVELGPGQTSGLGRNGAADPPINLISDDDDSDDEGGAINNHRQRRDRARISETPDSPYSPYSPQYGDPNSAHLAPDEYGSHSPGPHTVTDTSTYGSEAGDMNQADLLRTAGWSPLQQEPDSDEEGSINPYPRRRSRYEDEDEDDDDDDDDSVDSGTNTETVEDGPVDDEDDRSRDSLSQTPVVNDGYEARIQAGTNFHAGNLCEHRDTEDDSQEGQSVMDYDGDTDMSRMSPVSPRENRSVSANPYFRGATPDYGYQTPLARDMSVSTNESSEMSEHGGLAANRSNFRGQNLGPASNMQNRDAESSDSSIRRPPRRQRRRPQSNIRVQQQYEPALGMIFGEHQALRGTGSSDNPISFDDEEEEEPEEARNIEPSSSRRSMTAYRNMPARRVDPLRSSHSPSSTRIISSSQRNTRFPRQYDRRG